MAAGDKAFHLIAFVKRPLLHARHSAMAEVRNRRSVRAGNQVALDVEEHCRLVSVDGEEISGQTLAI